MSERRVVIVCFPGCELLDVAGAASVFGSASWLRAGAGGYRVELVALQAGPVLSSCGVALIAERALGRVRGAIDTLLVAGGLEPAIVGAAGLVPLLPALSRRARRTASVCSGAFLLAQAGLLRGKRAVTHWAGVSTLAERFPDTQVETDPIFVRDGDVWTSAGVTAGIDLALALVEQDHGAQLALEVARWGVMYLRRPGGQSQFSAPLSAQGAQDSDIASLLGWIGDNLQAELSIEAMAQRAHMSVRNFARVFRRETGSTPASYVERLRLDSARRALELSSQSVKQIAASTGFGSVETLHRAFQRCLSVTPLQYRARFSTPASKGARGSAAGRRAPRDSGSNRLRVVRSAS
jgi:transcriptional regulator GlxA family with amidase domain